MKSGFNFLDTYTLRARVFPAILAAMPALALMAAFVSLKEFSFTQTLAGIGLLAVIWIFADRAQRLGKQLEPGIWARMGGMPSTTALRHRDTTFNAISKASYHAFLAKKLGTPAPTPEQEAADPAAADAFYDRACAWLRDRTRDTKTYYVLFDNNMTYGARRNLLGVKPYALLLNAAVVVASAGMLYFFAPVTNISTSTASLVTVFIVAAVHAGCFWRFVNEEAVQQAARTYGRQLILSCDTLNVEARPAAKLKAKTA